MEVYLATYGRGYPLGFWSGANSDNIYLGVQLFTTALSQLHLYYERTRKGDYGGEFVIAQYKHSAVIPFLSTFDDSPHAERSILGVELTHRLPYGFWADISILDITHNHQFSFPGGARYDNNRKINVSLAIRYNYEF